MKKIIPIVIVIVAIVIIATALLISKPVEKPRETVEKTTTPSPTLTSTPTETLTQVKTLKLTGSGVLINESRVYRLELNLTFEGEAYVQNITFEPKDYRRNLTLVSDGFQVSGTMMKKITFPLDQELYEYLFNKRRIYVYVAYIIDDKIQYAKVDIFVVVPTATPRGIGI